MGASGWATIVAMRLERLLATLTGDEPFPTRLLACNLADTKRRNAHLGHAVVDEDIARFDALLGEAARPGSRLARVGGDAWLVLGDEGPALVDAICTRYAETRPYRAGWRCRARSAGEDREASEVVTTSIARAARFVSAPVRSREEIGAVAERLAEAIGGAPVGELCALEGLAAPAPRWCCVARYPEVAFYCPFCRGSRFEWTDGDSGVYSGDGRCAACGAEVAFTDAGGALR